MSLLKYTAAAFFRNKGKSVVTEREFVMGISMDLRWMPPADTEVLLSLLLSEKVLEKDGEYLRPAFDLRSVDVPLGFRPPADMLKKEKRPSSAVRTAPAAGDDMLSELMAEAEGLGIKRKDFIISINSIQKRINADIEIAALLMLRENGVDVSGHLDKVYDIISKR
ncbi:MAG: DUF2240 family protein [Methanomassiliicoccaceae archaeon]|nr:DUF2240 family protein [Methanomassiliicoccaceae archaeon]